MKTCRGEKVPEYRLRLDKDRCLGIHSGKVSTPSAIETFIRENFGCNAQESFYVLPLSARSEIIGVSEVSRGAIDSTVVDPRIMLQVVLATGAPAFIVVHNHPSGSVYPSAADDELTRRLKDSARVVGLVLLDHVIVGGHNSFSYASNGKL